MTEHKVTLTEAEREALRADAFLMQDEWVSVDAVIESIVAARIAAALREAADSVWAESGIQWGRPDWIKWLRDIAAEYDPEQP